MNGRQVLIICFGKRLPSLPPGYLEKLTGAIVGGFDLVSDDSLNKDYLKVITKPFTKLIIQV